MTSEPSKIELKMPATEAAARAIGTTYLAQCDTDVLLVEVLYMDVEGSWRTVGVEPSDTETAHETAHDTPETTP